MELAPSNVPLSFEVTFDRNDLYVAMSVYDNSGPSPVLISGPSAMTLVTGYTYEGKFTGVTGKTYVIFKAVYTTSGFITLDQSYAQGSESIVVQDISGGGGSSASTCPVIGLIEPSLTLIGIVNC